MNGVTWCVYARARARVCVCVYVCVCARACVRVSVYVFVRLPFLHTSPEKKKPNYARKGLLSNFDLVSLFSYSSRRKHYLSFNE